MTRRLMGPALGIIVSVLPIGVGSAQVVAGEIDIAAGRARVRSAFATGGEALAGWGLGASGTFSVGRVGLRFDYFQVDLSGDRSFAVTRSTAQGDLVVSVQVNPWLWFGFGPTAVKHRTILGDQRWTGWAATLGASVPVQPDRIMLVTQLAIMPVGSVTSERERVFGSDMKAGIEWRVPATPARVRLVYRFRHARASAVSRSETMDHLILTVGFDSRRSDGLLSTYGSGR